MKLMLVDDEKLTRDGLMRAVDWKALGIEKVVQAADGVQACELATAFQPDILLSDVRMPHMNGIETAEKLQAQNPCMAIVFMSGYSDKEYLKAAIRLKAVSYVEKPIDIEEVSLALERACESVRTGLETARTKEVSALQARSALALRLTAISRTGQTDMGNCLVPDFPLGEDAAFFTLLVKLHSKNPYTPDVLEEMTASAVGRVLRDMALFEIHGDKQGYLLFFHIWGERSFEADKKAQLGQALVRALKPLGLRYHLVFGKTVRGADQIGHSYASAVIEMQNSFFDQENTFRIYEHHDGYQEFSDMERFDVSRQLTNALIKRDGGAAEQLLAELFGRLLKEDSILPNQVKDLYYKLMLTVREAEGWIHPQTADKSREAGNTWESVSECESFYELHGRLTELCEGLLSRAQVPSEEISAIYMIKEYIEAHYQEEALSIKEISQHVFLSSSYICTLFKNETGKTLNQYITDYRIEQAQKLLLDPRYKITDISAKVGYNDGSYFGKIFKKQVGMSPSEYREHRGI